MGHHTPQFIDESTHQIWTSYPKEENKSYAPDSMPILETRSEVKVTLTQKLYATLNHPRMHLQNKFGIPTSNNIRDMLRTRLL